MEPNRELLIAARESRGLTQTELARRAGIAQGTVSKMEKGVRQISDEYVTNIAQCLQYPIDFFYLPDRVYGAGVSELFHRKGYNVPVRDLARVHAVINILRINVGRMLNGVDIGELSFRSFDLEEFGGDVEAIARAVRAMWHVPEGPIRNVVEIIEGARGIVIPVDFGTAKIDAISQWLPGMPLMLFVSDQCPPDRLRFTLCHEIGHIVMHQNTPNLDMESQAHRFAAEFLMPAAKIRSRLSKLTLPKLAELKMVWKVSMAALLNRASDLETITVGQVRYLWAQLSSHGYRLHEPALGLTAEAPSLYREIADTYLRDMGYSVEDFAKAMCMSVTDAKQMFWPGRANLRVIKNET